MRCRIDWVPSAEQDLAALWTASGGQAGVTAAADSLEREPTRTPLTAGESRESPLRRIVLNPPVGFLYEVIPDDYRVMIRGVFPV